MQINTNPEIEKLINSLEKSTIAKVVRTIALLEEFSYKLLMPHSRKISDNLFELRIRGQQEVRIFYSYHKNEIYLLTGFIKKSQTTPQKELDRARKKSKLLTLYNI